MANTDKAISDLATASEIKNSDFVELSQDTGNGKVSLKATILAIATKILTAINFTSALQTTDKTVIGAINEVAQGGGGGSSTLDGLNDVDIDDTTLADGQALVYNGTSEKWENGQGGGGGTGGHTIIDENGNSMTARAGLQFVGANVSDDATNDKTIVDLASAGGIDGVFVDTDNVIIDTSYQGITDTYTATEDCYVMADVVITNSVAGTVKIGNEIVCEYYYTNAGISVASYNGYLKKGQTLTIQHGYQSGHTFKVYGIQTGTTHSKFQPVIYSTEEREIGVWTDGKPLYEKTIIDTLPSSTTSKDIPLNVSNIDKIVSLKGIAIRSDGGTTQIEHAREDDTIWSMINGAKTVLAINIKDSSYINQPVHFTLQYTKTTDVAGSGTWTPQGVPAVHYSTDEQVIGTWIDGSTLYEKTFSFSASYGTGWSYYNHQIANIDKIIKCEASLTTDGVLYELPQYRGSGMSIVIGADSTQIQYINSWIGTELSPVITVTLQYTKSS
jgi:hypothetical protein